MTRPASISIISHVRKEQHDNCNEKLDKARKALEAIQARYMGKFDEDALGTYGPLSYDRALDMNHIATSTLKEIE